MIHTANALLWEAVLAAPLEQKIGVAPDEIMAHIVRGHVKASNALLPGPCGEFVADIQDVIAKLPATIKRKLHTKLLGVFVAAGLDSSATTEIVAYPNGDLIGAFVVIDIDVFFYRTANEWATWKENNPFVTGGDLRLELKIAEDAENDRKAVIQYILLHEFGHVVAADSHLLPNWWEEVTPTTEKSYPFLDLGWRIGDDGKIRPDEQQDFPMRQHVKYYEPEKLPASCIEPLYQQLEATSFPTLYAATSPHEDFAESFATYAHTILLNKKRELVLTEGGGIIRQYPNFWKTSRSAAKTAFFSALFNQDEAPSRQRLAHAANAKRRQQIIQKSATRFLALAPFLRLSIANVDLRPIANTLLNETNANQDNAFLWMNLSTVFFTMQEKRLGLAMQSEALAIRRIYEYSATKQPAKAKLLVLAAPGDLAWNCPIDCLLEDSHIDLVFYFSTLDAPLPNILPDHDAVMVAISYTDDNKDILTALEEPLSQWPKPVINKPQYISCVERNTASKLLQGTNGLSMPLTHRVTRSMLQSLAEKKSTIEEFFGDCRFPIILRPTGSQGGHGLEKIESPDGVAVYLSNMPEIDFYASNFVDYRSPDGLYRKYRIALVNGQPFICHMAISSHWMIHYVNAGMYEDDEKRKEEGRFMENFSAFAAKHQVALSSIHERAKLDYICIDCAETQDGDLLIFEIDHAMVVHAMDSEELFPHKQAHVFRVRDALENLIVHHRH